MERDRQAFDRDRRIREVEAFERVRSHFRTVVRPVLSGAAETLQDSGIHATVTETIRDEPPQMPRCVDLVLCVRQFERKGAAKLVITGVEGRDVIRTRLILGPGHYGGPFSEGEAIEHVGDLSEERVGHLVATLAELAFGAGR
jgi:hypothetical protein